MLETAGTNLPQALLDALTIKRRFEKIAGQIFLYVVISQIVVLQDLICIY